MWDDFSFSPSQIQDPVVQSVQNTHTHKEPVPPTDDPIEKINQMVMGKQSYKGEEQAIYHPLFQQLIKLRNNKMMDIFVGNDNGIRLDPNTESINVHTNHLKWHIHNMTGWITGSMKHQVSGDLFESVKGERYERTSGNAKEISLSDLIQEIKGNHNVKVGRNQTIEVDGDLHIKVNGRATIESDGDMDIRSKGELHHYGNPIDHN